MNPKWRDAPRRLYELSLDRWIISAIIPTLPGWLALGLNYFGVSLGLLEIKTGERHLTTGGCVTVVVVFTVCTAFALVRSWVARYEKETTKNSVTVLKRLLASVNAVTGAKLERFLAFIREHKGPLTKNPFVEITQPLKQIEQILENLRSALGEIHGIDIDRIGISLVCRKRNEVWSWLVRVNGAGDLELPRLAEPGTLFHAVMIDREADFFFPDKKVAEASRRYVPSEKDRQYGGVGSIIVRNLSIQGDDDALAVALSINTYGLQFCVQDDYEAKKKILEVVLPCFESRLRLELCLHCIKGKMDEGGVERRL